jgi:hypothetical protein
MAAKTTKGKRRLHGWDTYVQEASRPSLELPLPDGTLFELHYPSKKAIDVLNRKNADGTVAVSDDDFVIALCGEAEGCRLLELATDTPAGTLQLMLGDAMMEWGIWKENPFRKEGNQEDAAEQAAEEQGNSPGSPT